MSGFPAARAWLGGFCLAIVCGSAANGTEVYQWVDRDGLTRYTIRRGPGRVQRLEGGVPVRGERGVRRQLARVDARHEGAEALLLVPHGHDDVDALHRTRQPRNASITVSWSSGVRPAEHGSARISAQIASLTGSGSRGASR